MREDPLDQINLLRPWDLIAARWIHKLGTGDGQRVRALLAPLESERVRLASHMMGTMSRCVAQLGEQIAGQKAEINAEATEQLRALGYIQ